MDFFFSPLVLEPVTPPLRMGPEASKHSSGTPFTNNVGGGGWGWGVGRRETFSRSERTPGGVWELRVRVRTSSGGKA